MISLKNINKAYTAGQETVQALKDINLQIENGEFVAIVGPSGSGKSTLLNLLGGLDFQTSGELTINNKNLQELNDSQLSSFRNNEIGFVFQDFNLHPNLNLIENLELPLILNRSKKVSAKAAHKKAVEALTKFDLKNRIHHTPLQLSGGQKQRTAIARALINSPKIILADEPTGNLDSQTGRIILHILKKLHTQKKVTMIIVTHDYDIASYADRIIEIKDGSIVKKGAFKKYTS